MSLPAAADAVPESTTASSKGRASSTLIVWTERALVGCLALFALAAPHSIAATQTAWLVGLALWVGRLALRPRFMWRRTPVDYALLGFFCLTFISALFSYDPDVSIGKLRAASLFTIVYLVAENVGARRTVRMLALVLVASCMVSVVWAFGTYAVGHGVKIRSLTTDSPLPAIGIREGDTVLDIDGEQLRDPSTLARAMDASRAAATGTVRLRVRRVESEPVLDYRRIRLLEGATPEARLGIERWSYGRDRRASGFYGQYVTYAEMLQLVGALALGLLLALRRKLTLPGALLATAVAALAVALLLTVTRASWLGFLLAAFVMVAVGASRRTLVVIALVAAPLVLAGLFVLQQKRQVGFIDRNDGSTTWRLMVWRDSLSFLAREPRHLVFGVGMDSIKRHYLEWGFFDEGRQPLGHLHSTPLQLAFERGLPALFAWLALVALYARMLVRLARSPRLTDWVERGIALGALGGLCGFLLSGLVHYNLGDSEVAMVFYFIMGLALGVERFARESPGEAAAGKGINSVIARFGLPL